jgi:integrase
LEITKIYNHDLSKKPELDSARDNLIIGLWTGLRVSDFNNKLKIDNFDEDFIEIETEKTKTFVSIPVHWMIRDILIKRGGKLPEKVSDQKFNKHIKTIAAELKFDRMMMGGVAKIDPVTKIKRKVVDLYPKHELITSHICRRSFATNNFGTVSNSTLMAICGWKSEEQMLDYIKKTNREHAEVLKKVWDKKYKEAN